MFSAGAVRERALLTAHLFAFPCLKNHQIETSLALNSVLNLFCHCISGTFYQCASYVRTTQMLLSYLTVLSSICLNMSLSMSRVCDLAAPMHLDLHKPALCAPCPIKVTPKAFLKLQMAPRLILWMSFGCKKKEPKCACLSEAKVSNSQRMWAEVSSITPHFLHNGLSCSPSR
jgi:hypothetical protein